MMCIFVGPYIIKKRQNIVTEPRGSLLGEEKKKKEWTSNSNAPSFVASTTTTYTYGNFEKRWHGRRGKVRQ